MTSQNIENFKIVTNQLKDVLENLQQYHLGEKDVLEPLNKMETNFAIWYYEKVKNPSSFDSIGQFSSFQFLENFYNKFFSYYDDYFTTKNSEVKKSFFFSSESKKQNQLEKKIKRTEKAAEKLFTAVNLFIENAEKSADINQQNTVKKDAVVEIKTDSESELTADTQIIEEITENNPIEVINDENIEPEISNFEETIEIIEETVENTTINESVVEKESEVVISEVEEQITEVETTESESAHTELTEDIEVASSNTDNNNIGVENIDNNIVEEIDGLEIAKEELTEEIEEDEDNEDDGVDELEKLKQMLHDDFESKLNSL